MENIIVLLVIASFIASFRLRKDKAYFLPIAALASLGVSAYQGYQASRQRAKASKLQGSNYVPPAVQEAEANARVDSNATASPGYVRGLDKLKRSTAASIDASKRVGGSSVQLQQAVADTDAREKEIIKDLEVNNDQFRAARRQDLNRALQIKGEFQQRSQDALNAAKSSLIGAAGQNEFNAISGAAEGLIYGAPDSAFGGGGGAATQTGQAPAVPTGYGINPYRRPSPSEIAYMRRNGVIY